MDTTQSPSAKSNSPTPLTTRSLDHAADDERIVISHDTDFGTLLAFRRLSKPSFILIRSSDPMTADDHAALIVANLDAISDDLAAGAIVVFARGHLRTRRLPVR